MRGGDSMLDLRDPDDAPGALVVFITHQFPELPRENLSQVREVEDLPFIFNRLPANRKLERRKTKGKGGEGLRAFSFSCLSRLQVYLDDLDVHSWPQVRGRVRVAVVVVRNYEHDVQEVGHLVSHELVVCDVVRPDRVDLG